MAEPLTAEPLTEPLTDNCYNTYTVSHSDTYLILHSLYIMTLVTTYDDTARTDCLLVIITEVLNLALLMCAAVARSGLL